MGTRGKEFGTVTSRKRRCGWFDGVLVRQTIKVSGIDGIAIPSIPETLIVCLTRTPSNHPHLLFLLVTVPNSFPRVPKSSPTSSVSSVGKGPSPTLVV